MEKNRLLEIAGLLTEAPKTLAVKKDKKFTALKGSDLYILEWPLETDQKYFVFTNFKDTAFLIENPMDADSYPTLKTIHKLITPLTGNIVVDEKLWNVLLKNNFIDPDENEDFD